MKRLLLLVVLALLAWPAVTQEFEDVLYLPNGEVVRGEIIAEQTFPERTVTIRTSDGEELEFALSKVDRVARERVESASIPAGGQTASGAMADQSLEINALGLVQFGPYMRYHVRLADEMYLSPHVRIGYLGLLYLVFDWWAEIGVGTSYLTFWPTGIGSNRFYAGPVVEIAILREDGSFLSGAGAMGNFGHRWYLPSGQFMQVGLLAGVSFNFVDDFTTAYGMLELSWGFDL